MLQPLVLVGPLLQYSTYLMDQIDSVIRENKFTSFKDRYTEIIVKKSIAKVISFITKCLEIFV